MTDLKPKWTALSNVSFARVAAEAFIIVVSILLAFGIEQEIDSLMVGGGNARPGRMAS